jgi:hypothetical protein
MIEEKYTKAAFKTEIDKGMRNLLISKDGKFTKASFNLFGLQYNLVSDDKNVSAKTVSDEITSSSLYKQL